MKRAVRILHLFIVVSLVGTFLNAYILPSVFPYFNYISIVFPYLFGIHLLFLTFYFIRKEKLRWIYSVATLLLLIPLSRWITFSFPTTKENTIKILSLNANSGLDKEEEIQEYIRAIRPDFVFFQESRFNKSEFLKLENLPFNARCYLTLMYSKHPILEEGTIVDSVENWGQSHYMDVVVNGKRTRLINVYLESFRYRPNAKNLGSAISTLNATFKIHEKQIEALKIAIQESPYPIILAGDFNSTPNSYEYYQINALLQDSFTEGGKGLGTSFWTSKFPLRIDYIFSSKDFKCISYKVDHSVHLSDHQPIIAEFLTN